MLIKNERQQKIWSGIRYVTSPNRAGDVTKVIIPQEDGDDEVCTTKETVERGLANSRSDCFSCADNAPLCQSALVKLLGYSADTDTAEQILEG